MMNNTFYASNDYRVYLAHHGVKGQKWGVRRYQNADGSYTSAGKSRYGVGDGQQSSGAKKGFWQKRKENFRNMVKYKRMKNEASEKYNLRELQTNADNESYRNEAARSMINRELKSIHGENTYRQTSDDFNPYGTKHADRYAKAERAAERYVTENFTKKYGKERLDQARRSELAYDGLAVAVMLGLVVGSSALKRK